MVLERPYRPIRDEDCSKGKDRELMTFQYNVDTVCVCSVQLARRVLQLEKLNSSLRQELSEEQSRSGELKQQVIM